MKVDENMLFTRHQLMAVVEEWERWKVGEAGPEKLADISIWLVEQIGFYAALLENLLNVLPDKCPVCGETHTEHEFGCPAGIAWEALGVFEEE